MHLGTNFKGKALVDNYHPHHYHYQHQQIIRGFAHHLDDGDLSAVVQVVCQMMRLRGALALALALA